MELHWGQNNKNISLFETEKPWAWLPVHHRKTQRPTEQMTTLTPRDDAERAVELPVPF